MASEPTSDQSHQPLSNLMLHLDVAGNHMDPPTGHDEHDNDRRAYLGLQQGQQWEPVKMYR